MAFRLTEYAEVNNGYQIVTGIGEVGLVPGFIALLVNQLAIAISRSPSSRNEQVASQTAERIVDNIVGNIVGKTAI